MVQQKEPVKIPESLDFQLTGLTQTEVEVSRQKYGANIITPPKKDPWWILYREKYNDPIIRILLGAALIAVVTGLANGEYIEGLGIIIAILLATTVAFINEYKAEQEFDILNQVNDETPIEVLRDGFYTTVPKKDLVVDDLVLLETGDEVPADGRLYQAVSLKVNESNLTGESKPVTKIDYCVINKQSDIAYPPDEVYRGTTIVDGHGIMQVTAVGDRTEIGQTAKEITEEPEIETPLNIQLDRLSRLIGVLGLTAAVLIDIALIVRGILTEQLNLTLGQWYFVVISLMSVVVTFIPVWLPIIYDGLELSINKPAPQWLAKLSWFWTLGTGGVLFGSGYAVGAILGLIPLGQINLLPLEVQQEFLTYFMIAVAVIVVAVPEGLALSVTLSLAYSMHKMTEAQNLVRHMHACETIGAATVICSDKTGTLTLNEMRVAAVNFPSLVEEIPPIIIEAIAVNSTANLERKLGSAPRPLGNPTEGATLLWLEEKGIDYLEQRSPFLVKDQLTFSAERKYMATLGVSPLINQTILHVKGAPEIIQAHCNSYLTDTGVKNLDSVKEKSIKEELKKMDNSGKRTLGFAYITEPLNYQPGVELEFQSFKMTWLGFVAINDPVRDDVPQAVKQCYQAGIEVKMITGDSPLTAREIAREANILNGKEESILTGDELRQMDDQTASSALEKVKVIARARPKDKQRIVKLLQAQGEVVAVTGDGTNDAPALKQAQVGLAMGKIGTSVAKEASDIVILDDSFGSIEKAVMWGRSLYQNIQKFILFQLTINVAACGIALLGPFIGINLPLTVTQLLWVNLIMDTFAALALATEPPNEAVMEVPPRNPKEFIISKKMAKNIFTVGSIFLVIFIGFLLYIQQDGSVSPYELCLFFTTFVMLQFWNMFNAKCFGLKESVFVHLGDNKGFITIAALIFCGQILMVQFGGSIFRTVPLSLQDWLIIILSTSLVLWVGEIQRFVTRKKL